LSGEEALDLRCRGVFDLVIANLRMAGLSGLEFLEGARKKYPRSTLMLAVGVADVCIDVEAMQNGASDFRNCVHRFMLQTLFKAAP
jgi:DNA-binding NtrC family response regulator